MSEEQTDARYRERMQKKKEIMDARIREASDERGVIIVNTGTGKGKSSAGFGMVARALGHGQRVGIVQFIKGQFATGEEAFFRQFDNVTYHVMGEGYTWETQDRSRDVEMAEAAWAQARALLQDETIDLVLLDELNIALKKDFLDLPTVLEDLANRPPMQHVVITGRGAPQDLIEIADTVTDMRKEKHAFEAGVKAQKGVEL
ncbi:cob(I)alamin adenosyltransferase [Thiohalospira halophila DSM 15071]|uniref:Corrinoid adenosyltransferase n=1 Tax=Thiohalospira halophila DSM 15071 TaxID=1123397 RepID=A0A1I1QDE2_9GAMM|nr:cob(I)yrinic acid a,c-diamide adenosyltransferase [Thiohalospira halophila]SFD17243.1 cob(I)alamin adenosyltransferase [Thiohalospira halophila DSM 15071]